MDDPTRSAKRTRAAIKNPDGIRNAAGHAFNEYAVCINCGFDAVEYMVKNFVANFDPSTPKCPNSLEEPKP